MGSSSPHPTLSTNITSPKPPPNAAASAAVAPGAQCVAHGGNARLSQFSVPPSSILDEDMSHLLSLNDMGAAALPVANAASANDLGEAKGLVPPPPLSIQEYPEERHQQQEVAPSQALRRPQAPLQPRFAPFTGADASAFSASVGGGMRQRLVSSVSQQGRSSCILQSFSEESRALDQITASFAAQTLDVNATTVINASLAGTHGSFSMLATALSANLAEEKDSSWDTSYRTDRGEACDDDRPRASRHTHVHGAASFFSMSLSSRPSSPLSPSPPVTEEYIVGYTSFHPPAAPPSCTEDDEYDHAMHGQAEFVKQLCDGTGDKNSESAGLNEPCDVSRGSAQQQSDSLHVKVGGLGNLSAISGLPAAGEPAAVAGPFSAYKLAATSNASAQPASPPLSAFQPLSTPANEPNEHQACMAISVTSVGTAWDASLGSASLDGSTYAHSQASSGNLQAALWPSPAMATAQPQPKQQVQRMPPPRAPFDLSPLLAQTWPRTAQPANAEAASRGNSQAPCLHQREGSVDSKWSLRPYFVGTTPGGVATLAGSALPGRGVYTATPAQPFHAANSYYTGGGTPPSGCPAQMVMLLPAFNESSSPAHSPQAQQQQQHLYALQVQAQTLSTSEAASAPAHASTHGSGTLSSPLMRPSTPPAMAASGGVGAVTLFYVAAPTAFAGLPSTGAPSLANTSSPCSISVNSCPARMTQAAGSEPSAPSPPYVFLKACSLPTNSESQPLPLQLYAGNVASQLPNAGMPASPEQAALHVRTSSLVGSSTVANLPKFASTEIFSSGTKSAGRTCSGRRPGAPAANIELTRKQVNVHGAMANVLSYYPYNTNTPPAPAAQIVTGVGSTSNSILTQSLCGSCWSAQSMNSSAECDLDESARSVEGAQSHGARGELVASAPRGDTLAVVSAPVLPVFIQMFPCELLDRVGLLNRVIEATCGREAGLVQGFESRSETSFIAHVRTSNVWELIYKLRCRVLMDRFGFWYAADIDQYVRMKEYCESVRRLPQQTRHFQTDGLPCMPLVVELSRAVDRALVIENTTPRCFDELVPITAVDRHRARMQGSSSVHCGHTSPSTNSKAMCGGGASVAGGTVFPNTPGGDAWSRRRRSPAFLTNEAHVLMPPLTVPGLAGDSYRVGGSFGGRSAQVLYADPHFLPPPSTR
ncbi:hypothetical protein LSCM1_06574 [Leishmania martiniquensis]|uniref:Uncharacterized protein n=1 Tax=Leishmania martiniquensis TaxID=1580590 RepID=A0A836HYB2_9TRYP|nr:hypothetical protein LSCM1_06574 [Leishmania martiniquensis]